MIPLKLQIKNFLSYGADTQEIDFSHYNLICLSGKNGHGKSALLDAITWAVWGQARKSSGQPKPDQGLLRLGQRNMKVVFDFEFNSQRYRVRREFTFAYGKPTAYLEFGMFDAHNDELITLTDKTIRKTQDKIELLLGLDFDSFVNSAFIRQGNAGEFSNKSPKERKEILGNILGLGEYDSLRKLAAEKMRWFEQERQGLTKLQEHLIVEISVKDALNERKQALDQNLKIAQQSCNTAQQALESIQNKLQKLVVQESWCEEGLQKIHLLEQEYTQILLDLKKLRAEWWQVLKKNSLQSDYSKIEQQKKVLEDCINQLRIRQKINWQIKEELSKHTTQYQKLEHAAALAHTQAVNLCQLELQQCRSNYDHYSYLAKTLQAELDVLKRNYQQAESEKELYLSKKAAFEKSQAQFDRRRDFYQWLILLGNTTKKIQDEIGFRQKSLELDCASCPLCTQCLSDEQQKKLITQLIFQKQAATTRFVRITHLLKSLKEQMHNQHESLSIAQSELEQLKSRHSQITQNQLLICDLEKKILVISQDLLAECEKIKKYEQRLNQLRQVTILFPEQPVLQEAIDSLEKKLSENPFSETELHLVEQEYGSVMEAARNFNQDKLGEQRLALLRQLGDCLSNLRAKKKLLADLLPLSQKSVVIQSELIKCQQDLANAQHDLQQAIKVREELMRELVAVQTQLDQLAHRQIELSNLTQKIQQLGQTVTDYKNLTMIFGKEGIQALLIEEAIPEIEHEANLLLARLTDNQAQLFIDSLRDLKSGGTKETLDIKISDAVGLRPYEMFSGGEAFRIDFALRIAISKLLARRAGTALQTLIIDEGFGSQDEDGLAHIMDAIYKIQADFAKIIIVSHLPAMKEQFPIHFYVQKGATGSTVSVLEQG